jgi:hypothetical protein
MTEFSKLKKQLLQDPEVHAEYDALEEEFAAESERLLALPDSPIDGGRRIE